MMILISFQANLNINQPALQQLSPDRGIAREGQLTVARYNFSFLQKRKRNLSCLPQPLCILPTISQGQNLLHLARSLDLSLRHLPRAVLWSMLMLVCFYRYRCFSNLCGNLIATKDCGLCSVSHHRHRKISDILSSGREDLHTRWVHPQPHGLIYHGIHVPQILCCSKGDILVFGRKCTVDFFNQASKSFRIVDKL